MTLQELISSNSCAVAVSFGGHGLIFVNHLAGEIHIHNVGKTMSETTHDWEWFMPPIIMLMTGGWSIIEALKALNLNET